MKRIVIIAVSLFFLTACATTPTATSLDQETPAVIANDIYIERAIAGEPEEVTIDDQVNDNDIEQPMSMSQVGDTAKKVVVGGGCYYR